MGQPMTTTTLHQSPEPMSKARLPGRVVLVMQGGGAPGSYQAGAYQALHEAGIEPDWVIGTSIGAINGAIIAGMRMLIGLSGYKSSGDNLIAACRNRGVNWRLFSSECPASTR